MPRDADSDGGDRLLSYPIASGDMWYVEIGEREIFLRSEPQEGVILQGEMPHGGPGSHANFSQVLLEYCASCEACRGQNVTSDHVCQFAERFGKQLMARLQDLVPDTPDINRVSAVMDIVLNSMGVAFEREMTADGLRYELAASPIHTVASDSGWGHWEPLAQRAFVALSGFVVRAAAPDWVFVPPTEAEANVLRIVPLPAKS